MYIRNFDSHPPINVKLEALSKEGSYWFSYNCKIITWLIIVIVIVTAIAVLFYFGIYFGTLRTYLWMAAFSAFFLLGVLVIAPIRIIIFNFLDAVLFKGAPFVVKKKLLVSDLFNSEDPDKKRKILQYRKYNANLYTPTPLYKLQSRLEDIKYNLDLRNLMVDILAYALFMATIFFIIFNCKTPLGFYNNEMVLELVVRGNYTHTMPFLQVTTYKKLLKYLNETFLPALLITPSESSSEDKSNKRYRRRHSWNDSFKPALPQVLDARKRQILENFDSINADKKSYVLEKGWTLNHNLKLLGRPRLRQVRVETGWCKEVDIIAARNIECSANFNFLNVETGTFSLFWKKGPPKGLTEMQAAPWKYSSALNTVTKPILGEFAIYPGGGYVLELARNIDDARIVLDFLDAFQWIDIRTRALFIEFTVYSVNTNLFNVVTLVAEKSATGIIVPSYQVYTCKFLVLENEFEFMTVIMLILLAGLLFFFMLRESLRIHRTSLKLYFSRTFSVLDLVIILLGVLSLVFLILRNIYVSKLLKNLELANNNEFVSFMYAACWQWWSVCMEAILVCLSSFKLSRLLSFRVVFFRFQTTLSICYRHFVDLVLELEVFIIAFTLFFYLILLNENKKFSNFRSSFCTMFARAVSLDDKLSYVIFNTSLYLAPLFFFMFLFLVTIIFVSLFKAAICVYYHKIRNIPFTNKYNLCDYMKYFLTRARHRDILRLKYSIPERIPGTVESVMRLRGGRNKQVKVKIGKIKSKKKLKRINFKTLAKKLKRKNLENAKKIKRKLKEKKKLKEAMEEKVLKEQRIMMKDFVIQKSYDFLKYTDLDAFRDATMRNLIASFLTDDENLSRFLRFNALKGLFISFTTKSKKMNSLGEYFFVVQKSKTEIYNRRIFNKMRKVLEDFGKEKQWFVEEEINEEIGLWDKKLSVLNKKLSLLLMKKNDK